MNLDVEMRGNIKKMYEWKTYGDQIELESIKKNGIRLKFC